ncbi:MAG: OmpA family protein [Planctomycetota bacterium]
MATKRAGRALGAALLILATVGGCRSTSEDRVRELEAQRADLESRNKRLSMDVARSQQDKIRDDADLERERAKNEMLSEALIERPTQHTLAPAPRIDTEALRPQLERKGVRVEDRADGSAAIVLASDAVRFSAGKADITAKGETTLRRVAMVLMETEGIDSIRVEGHTDSDPIRRSGFKSNEHLSLERARKVRMYLVKLGLAEDQLDVKGYGAQRPIAPNDSKTNKALNRRVEIVLTSAR